MRIIQLFILCLGFSLNTFCQVNIDEDPACREKCTHASISSREQQVLYYQYPSMDKYDIKYLKIDLAAEAGSRYLAGTSTTVAVAVQQPVQQAHRADLPERREHRRRSDLSRLHAEGSHCVAAQLVSGGLLR